MSVHLDQYEENLRTASPKVMELGRMLHKLAFIDTGTDAADTDFSKDDFVPAPLYIKMAHNLNNNVSFTHDITEIMLRLASRRDH